MEEYLDNNSATPEQIIDVAPILKPEQVNIILKKTQISNLRKVVDLLPFISHNVVNQLAQKVTKEDNYTCRWCRITELKAQKVTKEDNYSNFGEIAPFVPKEQLEKIAEKEYESHGLCHFESIAPFLKRDYLDNLAQKAVQRDGIAAISPIAPFLSKDMLSKYVKEQFL